MKLLVVLVVSLASLNAAFGIWCIGPKVPKMACQEGWGPFVTRTLWTTEDILVPQQCRTTYEDRYVCSSPEEGLGWKYPSESDLGSTCTGAECY